MVKTPASWESKTKVLNHTDSRSLTQHEMTMSSGPLAPRSGIELLSLT